MTKTITLITYLLLSISIISAQTTPCPVNYSSALNQTQAVCEDTRRNEACYGNNTVNITPFSPTIDYEFDTPGDTANIETIRSLSLSALDEESGDWGISMIRLLANLDPNQADDVTMLLFGDVEIESAIEPAVLLPVRTATYTNIRQYPNTTSTVVSSVTANTTLIATGQLADSSWIQVKTSDSNDIGWIFADLLYDFDNENLSIVAATQPYFAPMQAFYFTGSSQVDCASVPVDGILIQTPMGVGRVTVWINEVTVDFISNTGATALVQAASDDTMSIELLEGNANITSGSGGYVAVQGSVVTVDQPKDDNLLPKVNPPKPASQQENNQLPIDLFDRPVEPSTPASIETIASSNNLSNVQYDEVIEFGVVLTQDSDEQSNNNSANSTTSQSDESQEDSSETVDNTQDCNGNSCNAPGKNKDKECPGNSCNSNGNGNNGNGNGNNGNGNGNNGNGNGNNGNGNGNGKKK